MSHSTEDVSSPTLDDEPGMAAGAFGDDFDALAPAPPGMVDFNRHIYSVQDRELVHQAMELCRNPPPLQSCI